MAEHLSAAPQTSPSSSCNGTGAAENSTTGAERLRRWAEEGLAVDGELIEGKHSHAELLLLAHAILVAAPGESLHASLQGLEVLPKYWQSACQSTGESHGAPAASSVC